ncbi:hypothetical protein, partial [Shimia sp.]|uniref:hypothetical protein n=1 Tax=Shimia sp. TaxID=1954381 RepID=UPI0035683180
MPSLVGKVLQKQLVDIDSSGNFPENAFIVGQKPEAVLPPNGGCGNPVTIHIPAAAQHRPAVELRVPAAPARAPPKEKAPCV